MLSESCARHAHRWHGNDLTLRLGDGGTLTGRVVDGDGQPSCIGYSLNVGISRAASELMCVIRMGDSTPVEPGRWALVATSDRPETHTRRWFMMATVTDVGDIVITQEAVRAHRG